MPGFRASRGFLAALVTDAPDSEDECGALWISLDLFPEAPDMDVHGARFHEAVLTPDLIQQLRSGVDAASMLEKELQKTELHGG